MNSRLFLKSQLYSISMIDKDDIEQHIMIINNLNRQLTYIGVLISHKNLVDKI